MKQLHRMELKNIAGKIEVFYLGYFYHKEKKEERWQIEISAGPNDVERWQTNKQNEAWNQYWQAIGQTITRGAKTI